MSGDYADFTWGAYTFHVQKAGGIDGMDGFFLLAQAFLPALEELLLKGREAARADALFRGAEAARDFISGKDVEDILGEPKDFEGTARAPSSLASMAPLLGALRALLASLPAKDREELRRLFLFTGAIEVVHPKSLSHEDKEGKKVKRALTRDVMDELYTGDPLGAWLLLAWVVRHNLGKSSPALAVLGSLFKRKGGASSSVTSDTSADGATDSKTQG